MSLIEDNIYWMAYNASLAVIAVVCGWLSLKVKRLNLRLPLFGLWLLFIPNTLYLLSDSIHFSQQLSRIQDGDKITLIIQYIVLMMFGILSFVIGVYPIEKLLKKLHRTLFLIALQFVIAFGIVMGRVERTHSWEVFFDPLKVFSDALTILTSVKLLFFVVVTGIAANAIYFILKPLIIRYVVRK